MNYSRKLIYKGSKRGIEANRRLRTKLWQSLNGLQISPARRKVEDDRRCRFSATGDLTSSNQRGIVRIFERDRMEEELARTVSEMRSNSGFCSSAAVGFKSLIGAFRCVSSYEKKLSWITLARRIQRRWFHGLRSDGWEALKKPPSPASSSSRAVV